MTAVGDSRSVFVVQRHFRRVRRGYDPEEVDRHLQLVREWFEHARGAEMTRELEAVLTARERALAEAEEQLRTRIEGDGLETAALLEGARLHAAAEGEAAQRIRREAEAERERLLHRTRLEAAASKVMRDARERAEELVGAAQREAEHELATARASAEQHLADARATVERELASARTSAEQQVADARATVERQLASARTTAEEHV